MEKERDRRKKPGQLSFTELKNKKGEALESYLKKIAEDYANSATEFSSSYYTERESVTTACFYRIIDEAVVRNLVNEKTVCKMETKAMANQKNHCQKAGGRTAIHYSDLRRKREEYILSKYSEVRKMEIMQYMWSHIDDDLNIIKEKFNINFFELRTILKYLFTNPKVDINIPLKLELRAYRRTTDEEELTRLRLQFQEFWNERNKNVLNSFSEEEKLKIATYTGDNKDEDLKSIADRFQINENGLLVLLKDVFINPDIDMDIPMKLEMRAYYRASSEDEWARTKQKIKRLWEKRKNNSQEESS